VRVSRGAAEDSVILSKASAEEHANKKASYRKQTARQHLYHQGRWAWSTRPCKIFFSSNLFTVRDQFVCGPENVGGGLRPPPLGIGLVHGRPETRLSSTFDIVYTNLVTLGPRDP